MADSQSRRLAWFFPDTREPSSHQATGHQATSQLPRRLSSAEDLLNHMAFDVG